MQSIWLEVALNGPWGQSRQPLMPIRVQDIIDQGIACAQEGAGIIHVHAYDEQTGQQKDDWQIYARIIEGIRHSCEVLVYPTIPLAGSDFAVQHAATRFAHVHELAKRGLIEMTVLDPGSVNFIRYDQLHALSQGFIYMNPLTDIEQGMAIAHHYQLVPGYAIYEPGFTRLGAALARHVGLKTKPIYRFMFSDEFAWGYPPTIQGLEAHLAQYALQDCAAYWMIAGLGVDIRPLIAAAVQRGGHVRVGLEDAPWGTSIDNIGWTRQACALIRQHDAELATPSAIRQALRQGLTL